MPTQAKKSVNSNSIKIMSKQKQTNMLQSTTTEDTLNMSSAEQESHNSSYSQRHEAIEGTPFHITGNEEEEFFLRMGDFQLSPKFKSKTKVHEYITENHWNIIMSMIGTALMRYESNKEIFAEVKKRIDKE